MQENVIVLKWKDDTVFWKYIDKIPIEKFYYQSNMNVMMKFIRKINLDILIWGDWKKRVKEYTHIIIFDNGYKENIARYIKKKNHQCKIIFYYWNPIMENNKKFLADPNLDEIWTFDKRDAEKYGLKYNPQFYTSNIKLDDDNITNDVYFLGRAKNRAEDIKSVENKLLEQGIKTNFNIIYTEKDTISYTEYLNNVSYSKSILDITDPSQTGLTLRCLESIFLEKKLITNNRDIKNYDFYKKNNIFIIGEDDFSQIKSFLNSNYEKIEEEVKEKYDFEKWLNRILETKKKGE